MTSASSTPATKAARSCGLIPQHGLRVVSFADRWEVAARAGCTRQPCGRRGGYPHDRRFCIGRVGHSRAAADKSNVGADTGDQLHDAAPLDPPERPRRDPTVRRLYLFVLFLCLCFLALIYRYATFMTGLDFPAEGPAVRLPEVERGPILDRNGRVLALTIERDSVTAWVPAVTSPEDSAELLAKILDTAAEEVLERLRTGGFVFIRRHITSEQSALIRAALDNGELQGIGLRPEQTRSYPEGALAAHLLGLVGVDNVGLEGIENTFNYVLAPDTITADGTSVFGNKVFLTIDVEVQHAMEEIAGAARDEHDADAVFIIRCRRRQRRGPELRGTTRDSIPTTTPPNPANAGATQSPPIRTNRARCSRCSPWARCCRRGPSRPR